MQEDKKPLDKQAGESDFADEAKPLEAPKPETKPSEEVKPAAPEVDLHIAPPEEKTEATPEAKAVKAKAEAQKFVYDDPDLQGIEEERQAFYKTYKKANIAKWVVASVCLVIIIVGWLVPTYALGDSDDTAQISFYITIGVVAVALVILLGFSAYFKKKVEGAMKIYFAKYYERNNHYVFDDKVTDLKGTIDDKLDPETFKKSGLYKDVFKVGSRECLTFDYHGHHITFADAAATIKGQKSAQTVFVGKFLVVDNKYEGPELLIYFKGNKRALPPTALEGRPVLEDSRTMVVYGEKEGKKFLTRDVRKALAAFDTNATFVDMALSVQPGTTYIAMGYEDNLMVLPLDKPFDPAPTKQHRDDMVKIFDLIDAIDGSAKTE